MDPLNAEQRRKNMRAIKASGTSPEIILSKALFAKGYRYRKNDRNVLGKPDICFRGLKIAIFIDGEFWHGKNWEIKKPKISQNKEYWIKKIERNMERDKNIQNVLESEGWTVMRFWHTDVKRNLEKCIKDIERVISQKRHGK
jgi:DNA mismatch endonuclease Vsr